MQNFLRTLMQSYMNKPLRFLMDSDFLIALYKPDDGNHEKAKSIFTRLMEMDVSVYLSSVVLAESTTVISYKLGMPEAKRFYTMVRDMADGIVFVDEKASERGWRVFFSQKKKGTSYVDCVNIALAELYAFAGILSFDTFYPSAFRRYMEDARKI